MRFNWDMKSCQLRRSTRRADNLGFDGCREEAAYNRTQEEVSQHTEAFQSNGSQDAPRIDMLKNYKRSSIKVFEDRIKLVCGAQEYIRANQEKWACVQAHPAKVAK